ncbi:hypothetical protein OE88DRAFT_1027094 [Heliocybe sulcata]|uniref:Uncharacterized protein n=1 Tax=Heliocybe sulcata TaxID=5364 RepID=A0A5C3NC49_9AGAM|nr:hypothetical protein OE88DRAFT_1027094 [Heliocybe sulcata]
MTKRDITGERLGRLPATLSPTLRRIRSYSVQGERVIPSPRLYGWRAMRESIDDFCRPWWRGTVTLQQIGCVDIAPLRLRLLWCGYCSEFLASHTRAQVLILGPRRIHLVA